MVTLCLGTLVAGALGATIIPFLPFLVAVGVAAILGAAVEAVRGQFALTMLVNMALLMVFAQIGYAVGMAGLSVTARGRGQKVTVQHGDRSPAEALGSFRVDEK